MAGAALCGGQLSGEEGLIQSPNYPDEYTPNKECVWTIQTGPNYQVAVRFHAFELEANENCAYDYVEIRDGAAESAPLLGKFCGTKLPMELHSTGNELWMRFISDATVEKGGFSVSFVPEYDECAQQNHGCAHLCVNTLGTYHFDHFKPITIMIA